ncbi:hypothetical protein BKA61DRAFT_134818 [Leptodontidium sp. MPI-SDFR-AT-0119]|nr:hypothetical protein BKA61DRAFT_134818 [Leptodontidium sp. MPI-SDFR-AT-0119]
MTRLSQKRTMPFEEDLSFILAEAVICHASSGEWGIAKLSSFADRLSWEWNARAGTLELGIIAPWKWFNMWASTEKEDASAVTFRRARCRVYGRCCSERFVVVDQAFLLHSMDWTILLSSLKQEECSEDRSRSEMKSDMNGGTEPDEMVKWKSGRYRQSRLSSRLTVPPAFARLHGGFVDSLCLDSFALRLTPCSSSPSVGNLGVHRLSGPRAQFRRRHGEDAGGNKIEKNGFRSSFEDGNWEHRHREPGRNTFRWHHDERAARTWRCSGIFVQSHPDRSNFGSAQVGRQFGP